LLGNEFLCSSTRKKSSNVKSKLFWFC